MDLESLYAGTTSSVGNPKCEGCSILKLKKPCHSVMDYEDIPESQVLFLSDSIKYRNGQTSSFYPQDLELLTELCPVDFVTAAAVKCPSIKEADISTADKHICRAHVGDTIDKIKPILVFACGNLSLNMLTKKSGITKKRGSSIPYTSPGGHECIVVPLLHPTACIREPKNLPFLAVDIDNAYKKYILGGATKEIKYDVLTDLVEITDFAHTVDSMVAPLSVDIETTGLNFLTDVINTISFTTDERTVVIPFKHKDAKWTEDELEQLVFVLQKILHNKNNRKVFHNGKFDVKFFYKEGIFPVNLWDTKLIQHVLDENLPKGLMDLVRFYYGSELENL